MMEVSKADWKLFRAKLPDWQEAYMDRLNREYIAILSGEGNPSERFWALEKRIKEDKKCPGVRCELDKKTMVYVILELIHDGAITFVDLDDFSDQLKEVVQAHLGSLTSEERSESTDRPT